jgi:MFS family permease
MNSVEASPTAPELVPDAARSLRREKMYEFSMPVAIGLMEGGFAAVVAAKAFDAPPWIIAVVSAAPMFGNLSSLLWSRLAAGRPKVALVLALQALVVLCVAAIALSPRSSLGLGVLLVAVVLTRLVIAGIVTVRSVIWSLNYERNSRARVISRLQAITSLMFVLVMGIGALVMDAHPESFRMLYAVGAFCGCLGIWAYSGVVVQGERRQRVRERRNERDESGRSGFLGILKTDKLYARYQTHQFIAGFASMLIEPPLVYLVSKQIDASYFQSIVIVMLIPFLLYLSTIQLWARWLDRVHVAEFRAKQNVLWVIGFLVMAWGAFTLSLAWLAVGRILAGVVSAGGSLAWQLGHNDFAPKEQLSAYMAVHVTLTGLRGAVAPFLGMALYLGWGTGSPLPAFGGMGAWLFVLAAFGMVVAWRGFHLLHKDIQAGAVAQAAKDS